jgi:alpha-tubulin suppressor-like RCC1 family protein
MVLNAGVTNSGTYYVVVTNMSGMVISLPALVTVGNPFLLAWGYNNDGQLGTSTTNSASLPVSVASNVVVAAAGIDYTLFVTADGTLWAMGWNGYGQFGTGTTASTTLPVSVTSNVVAVAAGFAHSLFIKTDGTLWAMGDNGFGELGNGTTDGETPNPTPINVASNVVAVAAGYYHSLFVKTDGTLWGMGLNSDGELGNGTTTEAITTPINVASNVVAIAAGCYNSLFVKTDGTLWAMGDNAFGQLGNGTTFNTNWPVNVASNVAAVAAGYQHSLFMTTDGTLWAMGYNGYGELGNGTTTEAITPINVVSNVVAVAAGEFRSLFTKTDGTLWAMGENNVGQLGNGTANNTSLPVSLPHLPSVSNIFPAGLASHSLAIGINYNALVTLGNLNQLYTGSAISVTSGTMPPGLTVSLTYNGSPNAPTNVGSYTVIGTVITPNYVGAATNTLVINPNATVTLGNLNQPYTGSAISVTAKTKPTGLTVNLTYNGSPNAPTNVGSYTVIGVITTPNYVGGATNTLFVMPVGPSNQVVALGGTLTLTALAGNMGEAYQWFKDSRLIVGATNGTLTVLHAGLTNSGTYYVVMTNMSGMVISLPVLVTVGNPSLLAWGANFYGELGNGTNSGNNPNPTPVNVASNVVAGAAGAGHSLFVTTNGRLWAMGYNGYGQLGNGTTINTNLPVSVASNVVAVAAGYFHSLFVKTNGTLWAMGYNNCGQLGNGTTTEANSPINVASNVVAVAAGYYHSLFVKTDGTLWAMGYNTSGQLGNGTTTEANSPINVASNVVAVAAGAMHSLFVKMDGTLWAMGYNFYGQLGDGITSYGNSPNSLPINVASNVVAVAAGYYHSLFVKTDGTLWAMGDNQFGELGNGATIGQPIPTPINVASNVVAVAAGYEYSLFVKTDGTLWAMGENNYGQLGNGTTSNTNWPVSVPHLLSAANIFPADEAFHSLVIGFVQASAAVLLGNLNQTYTGSAISVTAGTTPPGLTVNLTYNGSPNAPTNPGSYTVIGTISDLNYYGSATNTLVINPNATVTLGNLFQLYTGSVISVTASTTPPGLTVNLTYNGSPNAPTNAGSYTVVGTVTDPNYYGSATNTLVVGLPPQSFTASSTAGSANGQQLILQLAGTPGYPYILQMATNLTPPVVWQCVFTNCADTNGNCNFTITNLTVMPEGFYRAVGQ